MVSLYSYTKRTIENETKYRDLTQHSISYSCFTHNILRESIDIGTVQLRGNHWTNTMEGLRTTKVCAILVYTHQCEESKEVSMKNRVSEIRRERGLTQMELAILTGIHLPSISYIENDRIRIWPGWKKRLARALGSTEEALFPEEEKGGRR